MVAVGVGGGGVYNLILSFINLTLDSILCSYMWLNFTSSADMINVTPPEM